MLLVSNSCHCSIGIVCGGFFPNWCECPGNHDWNTLQSCVCVRLIMAEPPSKIACECPSGVDRDTQSKSETRLGPILRHYPQMGLKWGSRFTLLLGPITTDQLFPFAARAIVHYSLFSHLLTSFETPTSGLALMLDCRDLDWLQAQFR